MLRAWPPAIVVHTDRLMPRPAVVARAIAFVVLVRPGLRGDAGVLAHELEHVAQFWAWVGALALIAWGAMLPWWIVLLAPALHAGLYRLSRFYRAWAEIRAYRAQINAGGISLDKAARQLANGYELGISETDAGTALLRGRP